MTTRLKKSAQSISGVVVFFAALILAVVAGLSTTGQQPTHAQTPGPSGLLIDQVPYPQNFLYYFPNSTGWPMVGTVEPTGTCADTAAACTFNSDCCTVSYGCDQKVCNNPQKTAAANAPLNQSIINQFARFAGVYLAPTPVADTRPDILAAIRAANPKIFVLAYTMAHQTWCPQTPQGNNSYPAGTYYRDYYLAVTGGDPSCSYQGDGMLWMQDGSPGADYWWMGVNIAKRVSDGQGGYTYPIAEALAQVMANHVIFNHQFDALFIDVYNGSVGEGSTTHEMFDYARAGYGNDNTVPANREAFKAGFAAGELRLATRLRELAAQDGRPDFPIMGNGGGLELPFDPYINGWMHENWPYQEGGTWYMNMYRYRWGMLHQSYQHRAPQFNSFLSYRSATESANSTFNLRKSRFGLASASLGKANFGFNAFEETPNYSSWYDEYAVDIATARADQTHIGWLGFPKGEVYQMVNPLVTADLVPVGNFEQGLNGWETYAGDTNATFTREAGAGPHGEYATKINTANLSSILDYYGAPVSWANRFRSPATVGSTYTMNAGIEYSATFWAKADRARTITIGNDGAAWMIPITTSWKQYQIALTSSETKTNQSLNFWLASSVGDVWLTDIHMNQGVTSVYRRDFDHGIILVNPSQLPQTVTLEKTYRKIIGTIDSTTNDGSYVDQVTLPGAATGNGIGGALFLIDHDYLSPAPVTDLRTGS